MSFEFREPSYLLACLAAVPVYFLLRQAVGRVTYSSTRLLPQRAHTWRTRLIWLPRALAAGAVIVFGIALAGPRVPGGTSRDQREGIAIMMVIDVSGSMQALDLSEPGREQTRLEVVKQVFKAFVQGDGGLNGRQDDVVGLVSFARYADSSCPLTLDHQSLTEIVDDLEIVTNPEENATSIGDALGLAVERLRDADASSRVAILLTDGVHNAGDDTPQDAARLAATLGIKVYTIGAGSSGFAPIRVEDPRTGRSQLRQVLVEIDEATLEEVAELTHGRYFRATDAAGLHAIYEEIDKLEKTEVVEEKLLEYDEYFEVTTAAALVLACFGWLLGASLLRRFP